MEEIKETLTQLLKVASFEVSGVEEIREEGVTRLNIKLEGAGALIGHDGENLIALESLLRNIIFKKDKPASQFILDVDDYRKSRIDFLVQMAHQAAKNISVKGGNYRFGPMNSYERRIVHSVIANHYDDLTTESEGDIDRRVVVKRVF